MVRSIAISGDGKILYYSFLSSIGSLFIFRSINSGDTFSLINAGLSSIPSNMDCSYDGNKIFMGEFLGFISTSNDSGITWVSRSAIGLSSGCIVTGKQIGRAHV